MAIVQQTFTNVAQLSNVSAGTFINAMGNNNIKGFSGDIASIIDAAAGNLEGLSIKGTQVESAVSSMTDITNMTADVFASNLADKLSSSIEGGTLTAEAKVHIKDIVNGVVANQAEVLGLVTEQASASKVAQQSDETVVTAETLAEQGINVADYKDGATLTQAVNAANIGVTVNETQMD